MTALDTPPSVSPEQRMAALARLPLVESGSTKGLIHGTATSLRDLYSYRELLVLLVRRELKARYKDSSLGFLWSLLRPLSMLIVYYVAIGKFLGAERNIPDFAVFIFTGLLVWQLFLEIVAGGTGAIVGNAGLIKKVYLPREVFPLAVVGSAFFNFFMQLIILLSAVLVLGRFPTGERWLFAPLALAVVVVWATAFGLLLGAVNVYLRDVQYLVEILLTTMFWATPVVYSWELVQNVTNDLAESAYLSNPVAAAVLGMQRTFWVAGTGEPVPAGLGTRLVIMLGIGVLALWGAQRVFSRLQANFAQEL